eukprot:2224502-Amphidinium_carterae.2
MPTTCTHRRECSFGGVKHQCCPVLVNSAEHSVPKLVVRGIVVNHACESPIVQAEAEDDACLGAGDWIQITHTYSLAKSVTICTAWHIGLSFDSSVDAAHMYGATSPKGPPAIGRKGGERSSKLQMNKVSSSLSLWPHSGTVTG